jgi:poly(3-hydroxyalkanoate) synthetase
MTTRRDLPGPLHRRGPRPLWLHLMIATQPFANWPTVLRNLNGGSSNATPDQKSTPGPDPALVAGIAAYRRHPWKRQTVEPPSVWQEGSSCLLDYGPPDGIPLLVVPSLVNRSYVLDLLPDHSMLRHLSANGIRPFLLDWGPPGDDERQFTLSDYIAGRLDRVLSHVSTYADGAKIAVAGYCMGGLMAVALAQRRPDAIARMALLATPWDFWAAGEQQACDLAALLPLLEPALLFNGTLPVDGLQILFSLLDPGSVGSKYRDFGAQDQTSARATMFVAIEDWLNDGVPLAAPVARETLGNWYGANTPARGAWRILGLPVTPQDLHMPCFVAAPQRDRLVPQASARALAEMLPTAHLHLPAAGHIGMVAGSSAKSVLWEPLTDWLRS